MAKKINILTPETYNKIAAGEVIDRPSSVVKELVENSIDASASKITVEVEEGGIGLISVSDDGWGIDEEDLDAVFLKHATSKLQSMYELEYIQTLGFRGEALSSISAVSHVVLTTRTRTAEMATRVCAEEGKIVSKEYVAANVGTTIEIRDLFYNTPARKKFLKPAVREAADVTKWVSRMLLTNSKIQWTYRLDGKTIYQTMGNGLEEAMMAVYGENCIQNCLRIGYDKDEMRISGLISVPEWYKSNTTYQTISVNGRYVEDSVIQGTMAQAYKRYYVGNRRQYPIYVLELEIPGDRVDVNVHPRKTEVRFVDGPQIAGKFYRLARDVLRYHESLCRAGMVIDVEPIFHDSLAVRMLDDGYLPEYYRSFEKIERPKGVLYDNLEDPTQAQLRDILKVEERTKKQAQLSLKEFAESIKGVMTVENARKAIGLTDDDDDDEYFMRPRSLAMPEEPEEESKSDITDSLLDATRILGTAFQTYMIFQQYDNLILVDQHAAHERILYDKFMENKTKDIQELLVPYVFNVKPDEAAYLESNLDRFLNAGIEVEKFGENAFRIKGVSTMLSDMNVVKFAEYMLSGMDELRQDDNQLFEEVIARKACRAAVKAGETLSEPEIRYILKMMYEKRIMRCPHGRPITITFSKDQLAKMFKRKL